MTISRAALRSIDPPTRPQYPYDAPPVQREGSKPTYAIDADTSVRIPMRDGVRLAADVFRPVAPGRRFPALVATSPYTRQLQRTEHPDGQNEAGISEFWVPHGYAHIVVDVRGTNESEGDWDHMGPLERRDLFDIIEWAAAQPWCDGRVGMTGESYYAWSQWMAAAERPPHLGAIFAQCGSVDLYRERYYHGGILKRGVASWFYVVRELNGRRDDVSAIRRHTNAILRDEHPFDDDYHRERLSWARLDSVGVPAYVLGTWKHVSTHLRSAFEAYGAIDVPKRLTIGPSPWPRKPMAAYHREALRWYDHHLRGMDTAAMTGDPIRLWVMGAERWRGEREWPLARTEWREYFLAGPDGAAERDLLESSSAPGGEFTWSFDPSTRDAYVGTAAVVYRTAPFAAATEVTGPLALTLWAVSTARDADWIVTLFDESPDGSARELTRGWLRASHRALDATRSTRWRPFHPHDRADPVPPGDAAELAIEIWPTSNLFHAGHRLRLDIANSDDQSDTSDAHATILLPSRNRVLEGRAHPSRLLVPVVPAH